MGEGCADPCYTKLGPEMVDILTSLFMVVPLKRRALDYFLVRRYEGSTPSR